MITQCKQTSPSHVKLDSFMVFMHLFDPEILKGSLRPKLKGVSFWPFNACNKVATG